MNLKTLSVTDAMRATNMSRDAIYELITSGAVAANRVGRNWRIKEASLEAWVNQTATPPSVETTEKHFPEVEKDVFA